MKSGVWLGLPRHVVRDDPRGQPHLGDLRGDQEKAIKGVVRKSGEWHRKSQERGVQERVLNSVSQRTQNCPLCPPTKVMIKEMKTGGQISSLDYQKPSQLAGQLYVNET